MSERTPQDVLRERIAKAMEAEFVSLRRFHVRSPEEGADGEDVFVAGLLDDIGAAMYRALDKAIAEAPDSPLPACGAVFDKGATVGGFRPEDMGCGKPIEAVADLYRCVQCSTPFHQGCARRHFDWPEAGGSLMPHALDAGLIELRAVLAPDTLSEKPGLDVERLANALHDAM